VFLSRIFFYFLIILLFSNITFAQDYLNNDFKNDWSAPLTIPVGQNILLWGGSATSLLILTRNETILPFQEYMSEQEPLGELSKYGDLAGQMIPNFSYMFYQWKWGEQVHAHRRIKYMFKVSFFAGMTTFFLKRLINERRPHKGDRNSFPSGHTTTAFAFASAVSIEHKNWRIPAYALASFVGLSRINDNAHYLHDVVMGATIGTAYGFALAENSDSNDQFFAIPNKNGLDLRYVLLF
jgi:hypothetical protein